MILLIDSQQKKRSDIKFAEGQWLASLKGADGTIEKQQYISDGGITVPINYDFSNSEFVAIKKGELQ